MMNDFIDNYIAGLADTPLQDKIAVIDRLIDEILYQRRQLEKSLMAEKIKVVLNDEEYEITRGQYEAIRQQWGAKQINCEPAVSGIKRKRGRPRKTSR
jgi:hypothetical protein